MAKYIDADKLIGRMLLEKSVYEYRLSVMKDENRRNTTMEIDLRRSIDKLGHCVDMVKQAPIADVVEVKHGEWNKMKNSFYTSSSGKNGNVVFCSVCKEQSAGGFKTPYCSICGAKMDMKEGLVDD